MNATMIKDYQTGYNEGVIKGYFIGNGDGYDGKEKRDLSPKSYLHEYDLGLNAGYLIDYKKGYNEGVIERTSDEKKRKEERKVNGWTELKDLKIDINDYKFKMVGEYENDVTNNYNNINIGKLTIKELEAKIKAKIEASQKLYNKKNWEQCMFIDNVSISFYSINNEYLGNSHWSDATGLTRILIHEERMKEEMKK